MDRVWVVQRDCGDYYCGCGGGHIVGVFSDRGDIEGDTALLADKITEVPLNEARWSVNLDANDLHAWT